MNSQDWNVITFRKKSNIQKEMISKTNIIPTSTSSVTNKPMWKIEQQIDNPEGKPLQYISKTDIQVIIKSRVAMKLTQKDLACRLNMQTKEIQDIESGKALENKLVLSKIKKILNITKN